MVEPGSSRPKRGAGVVGEKVGEDVGADVGENVGDNEGEEVGEEVGEDVGEGVGGTYMSVTAGGKALDPIETVPSSLGMITTPERPENLKASSAISTTEPGMSICLNSLALHRER